MQCQMNVRRRSGVELVNHEREWVCTVHPSDKRAVSNVRRMSCSTSEVSVLSIPNIGQNLP